MVWATGAFLSKETQLLMGLGSDDTTNDSFLCLEIYKGNYINSRSTRSQIL